MPQHYDGSAVTRGKMVSVADRFTQFLNNLALTEDQKNAGWARKESVIEKVNSKYWNSSSGNANSKYVGSWGKATRIRPPRDVDVLFELPSSVYERFQHRTGNKQSQLLQEIRDHLNDQYPNTRVRGDGPVVLIPFSTYNVELIPAFKLKSGQYWICMTDNGGHYKTADYDAEIQAVSASNDKHNNNTRDLVRVMKCWQGYCSVPIKSFWLEIVAINFLNQWANAGKSKTYYDWMVRDFFAYLKTKRNSNILAPGTNESMNLGEAWFSRTETAHSRAAKACEYESSSQSSLAGEEWQKIFGTDIPK
jgi:hypothetical protein